AESKAAVRQLVRAKKNGEMGIRAALPGPVHGVKVSAPHQPRLARKIQAPRAIRERADDGPSCGAPQAPCGLRRSSCANGIRASWRAGACAVDTCALAKQSPLYSTDRSLTNFKPHPTSRIRGSPRIS